MSEHKGRRVFDEQALSKLLEAAFVLQEHNRGPQTLSRGGEAADASDPLRQPAGSEAVPDYTPILSKIADLQRRIQGSHLAADDTMALVAERVMEMTRASGAAIGLLDNGTIRYRAASGPVTLPKDTEIAAEKAFCAACLRSGQVMRCEDVDFEFLLDGGECQRLGIQSMIAVPIYQQSGIAGGLELYFDHKKAFTERDVHTCQLMAGLVGDCLGRAYEFAGKKSVASERSIKREAVEQVSPDPFAASEGKQSGLKTADAAMAATASGSLCRTCGHEILAKEQFCGRCGSPRTGRDQAPDTNRIGALGYMQEASKENQNQVPASGLAAAEPFASRDSRSGRAFPDSFDEETTERFVATGLRIREAAFSNESPGASAQIEVSAPAIAPQSGEAEEPAGAVWANAAPATQQPVADWSSALAARTFLEQVAGRRPSGWIRFWQERRGDIYLAIAVILVACAIRWGIWESHSVSATSGGQSASPAAHGRPAADDDLSLFDRMLVKLGLAEVPEPPESKGNPQVQVWVDLQTALYYCPGTDLYGKTPKGRFTTQSDAQLDQFEPAYRKVCN